MGFALRMTGDCRTSPTDCAEALALHDHKRREYLGCASGCDELNDLQKAIAARAGN